MTVFHNYFGSVMDIAKEFEIEPAALDGFEILYASYEQGGYEGSAYVLYRDSAGKLFEVYGSHCSCYGLEDQWNPEETTVEALRHRYDHGSAYQFGEAKEQFLPILTALEAA